MKKLFLKLALAVGLVASPLMVAPAAAQYTYSDADVSYCARVWFVYGNLNFNQTCSLLAQYSPTFSGVVYAYALQIITTCVTNPLACPAWFFDSWT